MDLSSTARGYISKPVGQFLFFNEKMFWGYHLVAGLSPDWIPVNLKLKTGENDLNISACFLAS